MRQIKDNLLIILIILVFVLIGLNIFTFNSLRNNSATAKDFDRAIAALGDSLKLVINKKGDSVYQQKVVSFDLDDFVKSEVFKSLDEDKKRFYLELQKTKGLLASAQAIIRKQDSILTYYQYNPTVIKTDSTITFNIGDSLEFSNSQNNLTYTSTILFLKDSLKHKLAYKYSLNIQTSFIRQKDKSIIVEYKTDDPSIVFNNGQAFIIPQEQKTKLGKTLDRYGKYIIPTIAFGTGVYIGSRIGQK
jgi:hypothetical protein